MLLPMAPDVFHRIQFGSIGRQKFDFEPSTRLVHKIPNQTTSMAAKTIPNNEKIARNMAHQVSKKFDNLRASDCSGKQPEVKRPHGDSSNCRNRFPIEMELKHWSLSTRGPRTTTVRPFAQSALVDEYDGLALQLGFFLSSGHRLVFHRRIVSSSRSSARVVGLWQLHPRLFSTFHTCPAWYLTPHSRSIRSATLQAVQRLVSYPNASGPRFSASRILSRSASDNSGLRPARPAFLRPAIPVSVNCLAHRFTDCRWTPTRRATSASWIPFFSNFAACSRRFSRSSKFRFTPAGFPMRQSIQHILSPVTILCGSQ